LIRIINKQIKEKFKVIKNNSTSSKTRENSIDNSKVLVVLYVKDVSNDIKQIVKNFVDVWYTIPKKLDLIIRKDKDSLKDYHNGNCVKNKLQRLRSSIYRTD